MDREALARLAGDDRVPHGSSDDPGVLDFSANTNPAAPEGAAGVYADAFDAARSYPDDGYPDYRAAAAAHVDAGPEVAVDPDWVVPTPGGLAAIRLALATAVDSGDSVLVPAPSFGEYAREVRRQGGEPVFVAHDAVLDRDPGDAAAVVVCNPNNPTGDAYDADALRAFAGRCRASGTLLLVDEAFLGFTDRPSLAGSPGVVVARSLTKLFGLPGLRAGFAVATGERRDRLAGGFDVHESAAPFLLLDAGSSERVDAALAAAREANLALRDARTFRGLDSHLRVAVRRPNENDRLCEVLADV